MKLETRKSIIYIGVYCIVSIYWLFYFAIRNLNVNCYPIVKSDIKSGYNRNSSFITLIIRTSKYYRVYCPILELF